MREEVWRNEDKDDCFCVVVIGAVAHFVYFNYNLAKMCPTSKVAGTYCIAGRRAYLALCELVTELPLL